MDSDHRVHVWFWKVNGFLSVRGEKLWWQWRQACCKRPKKQARTVLDFRISIPSYQRILQTDCLHQIGIHTQFHRTHRERHWRKFMHGTLSVGCNFQRVRRCAYCRSQNEGNADDFRQCTLWGSGVTLVGRWRGHCRLTKATERLWSSWNDSTGRDAH